VKNSATLRQFRRLKYGMTVYSALLTVDGEESEIIESQKFVDNYREEYPTEFHVLDKCLIQLDKTYERTKHKLKHERSAIALPFEDSFKHFKEIGLLDQGYANLRWYGVLLNDRKIILLNGAVKTARYPQECPNVRRHFNLAVKIADAIHKLTSQGDFPSDPTDDDLGSIIIPL